MANEKMGAKKKNQVGKKSIRSMYARVSGCVYTEVGACLCESMHMRVYVCTNSICVHAGVCIHKIVYICTVCIHTCVHMQYMCTHMCVPRQGSLHVSGLHVCVPCLHVHMFCYTRSVPYTQNSKMIPRQDSTSQIK